MSGAAETVLVLRVCLPGGRSHSDRANGFVWPKSGPVAAPDWRPTKECGGGLHGWLWGAGDITVCGETDKVEGAEWLVVEVLAADIVELNGKVKFPRGEVIYFGAREEAVKMVAARAPVGTLPLYATLTGGARSTLTGGDGSTLTGGYASTIAISWWCPKRSRYRTMFAEVELENEPREPGQLKANTKYKLDVVDGKAQFAEVRDAELAQTSDAAKTDEALKP